MSKIGKTPIQIGEGVSVSVQGSTVSVVGPKGTLSYTVSDAIVVVQEEDKLIIKKERSDENAQALFGLTRALIANMVTGVSIGFEKKLELSGVGYRAQVSGNELILSLGFSHPVRIKATDGISFSVAENVITIAGIDKGLVGNIAAKIREIRPPEPYKGKGILYKGERVRRKAGKAAKAVGGK